MKISKKGNFIRFLITKDEEGWHARAEGISIFTEGNTLEELKNNVKKAVKVHLADGEYKKYGFSSESLKDLVELNESSVRESSFPSTKLR